MDSKSELLTTIKTNNSSARNSITMQKRSSLTWNRDVSIPGRQLSISQRGLSIDDGNSSREATMISNLSISSRNKVQASGVPTNPLDLPADHIESQTTLDLLDKIRHIAHAEPIGPMPLSLQACRFALPFDLKLLEGLTPLDYLSKYCHLSSRRQYQFKRLFDKYRNRNYQFESSYLYLSLLNIHKHHLNYQIFDYLCELIDLNDQEYQFSFQTYAGIMALGERLVYRSSILYRAQDDYNLAKDTIEKCDFYSLERKFDGLVISDAMKQLLSAL